MCVVLKMVTTRIGGTTLQLVLQVAFVLLQVAAFYAGCIVFWQVAALLATKQFP